MVTKQACSFTYQEVFTRKPVYFSFCKLHMQKLLRQGNRLNFLFNFCETRGEEEIMKIYVRTWTIFASIPVYTRTVVHRAQYTHIRQVYTYTTRLPIYFYHWDRLAFFSSSACNSLTSPPSSPSPPLTPIHRTWLLLDSPFSLLMVLGCCSINSFLQFIAPRPEVGDERTSTRHIE